MDPKVDKSSQKLDAKNFLGTFTMYIVDRSPLAVVSFSGFSVSVDHSKLCKRGLVYFRDKWRYVLLSISKLPAVKMSTY
jgi:hypothetical protein